MKNRASALIMLAVLLTAIALLSICHSTSAPIESNHHPYLIDRDAGAGAGELRAPGTHSRKGMPLRPRQWPVHSGAAAADLDPTSVWDADNRHPGFGAAYQAATLTVSRRLMWRCQQVIVRNDPTDHRPRDYKFVDTYTNNGDGSMTLSESDVVPETDDDPEFFECLRSGRVAAHITVPITPGMGMGASVVLYESGRLLNSEPTPETIEAVLADVTDQLRDMAPSDPYRPGAELQLQLFRCYQENGTDLTHRLECLELAATSR